MHYFILIIFTIFGCASQTKSDTFQSTETVATQEVLSMEITPNNSDEVSYVVIHKTVPLYFQQDVSGDYLQFITPEESAQFEARVAAEERKILKSEREKVKRDRKKKLKQAKAKKKKDRARKRRKRKRKKKLSKKQRIKAKKRKALKLEKAKNRKVRAQRKVADSKIRAAEKRVEARFPDGNIRSFFAFRKLKSDGGWVQVETISQSVDLPHCHQEGLGRLGDLKMRFWVKSDAISPVISRSVNVEVPSGVPTRLLPGLGVLEEKGKQSVFVSGFKLDINLQNDVIGKSYTPVRGMDISMTDTVFSSTAIAKGLGFGRVRLPINPFFSKYVSQTLRVGSKHYAAFQSRCAEVFVRTRDGDIERGGPRKTTRFTGSAFSDSEYSIRAGSKITAPSGNEVGVVLKDFPISSQDDDRCFDLKVWEGNYGKREVRLCASFEK